MRVTTSKSKNAESFYITKGYINDKGVSTSVIVRKLGTLNDLLKEHGPTRDDVMAWAREEARIETLKRCRLHFMLTGSWITTSRHSIVAAIFSCSPFIMDCR